MILLNGKSTKGIHVMYGKFMPNINKTSVQINFLIQSMYAISLNCQPSPPPNPQGVRARETRGPCGLGGGDS